jgi:hypothetical protein
VPISGLFDLCVRPFAAFDVSAARGFPGVTALALSSISTSGGFERGRSGDGVELYCIATVDVGMFSWLSVVAVCARLIGEDLAGVGQWG